MTFPILSCLLPCRARRVRLAALPLLLLTLSSAARAQEWSPDSRQIALGGSSLLLVDATASPSPGVASVPGSGSRAFPSWSPDGLTVAFLSADRKLLLYNVMTLKLTQKANNVVSPARWAPDSKTFAIVRAKDEGGLQLRTLYRESGGVAQSVDLPFKALLAQRSPILAWIPGTDNVILASNENGKADLYLVDAGEVVRLTTSGDILGFAVSTDGSRVIWARRSLNTHYIIFSLYELTIQSRKLRKRDYPAVLPAVNPKPKLAPDSVASVIFSPDFRQLAFVTRGGPGNGPDGAALYLSDIAGQSVRLVGRGRVLGTSAPKPGTPKPPQPAPALPAALLSPDVTGLTLPLYRPAFSPDGRQLAIVRADGDKRTLLLVDTQTGQIRSVPL